MSYPKPWLGIEQQLDSLRARGLQVSDRDKALRCLQRIGYYRLSGYWFAFRERSGPCCLLLQMLRYLLSVINPTSSWPARLKTHLVSFPDLDHLGLNVAGMGPTSDWQATWQLSTERAQ